MHQALLVCFAMPYNAHVNISNHEGEIMHHLMTIIFIATSITSPLFAQSEQNAHTKPENAYTTASLQKKLDQLIVEIRAEGLPATAEELNDWYPIPENNMADQIIEAIELFVEPNDNAEIIPFFNDYESVTRLSGAIPSDMLHKIESFLKINKPVLDALRKINFSGPCRYAADYSDGLGTMLPHLAQLRNVARLLKLDSLYAIHESDYERAHRNNILILELGKSLQHEPLGISELVGMSFYAMALDNIESVYRISPPNLQTTKTYLSSLPSYNFPEDWLPSVIFDRACYISTDFEKACEVIDAIPDLPKQINRDYYYLQNKLLVIKKLNKLIKQYQNNIIDTTSWEEEILSISYLFQPARITLLNFDSSAVYFSMQEKLNTAQIALAAHQYKLNNNTFPQSLDDLTPTYIKHIKTDYYTSKPYRYKYDSKIDSIVVYSIGDDEVDNDGRQYIPYMEATRGRKPYMFDDEDESEQLTDITFTLGSYQEAHFPDAFIKPAE
ncbi:hypothetical protein JD969_01355 [Planctomycetota bacterium]|nr:hypothetical protein JD969_01355 [Planctomycetota bacterium]